MENELFYYPEIYNKVKSFFIPLGKFIDSKGYKIDLGFSIQKSIYNSYYYAIGETIGEYGFDSHGSGTLNGEGEAIAEINKRLNFLPYPHIGLTFNK